MNALKILVIGMLVPAFLSPTWAQEVAEEPPVEQIEAREFANADGETLLFHFHNTDGPDVENVLMPVAGGERRTVDGLKRWAWGFTPDGQSLVYIPSEGGSSNLWAWPLDGGEARQLTGFQDELYVAAYDWSSDGKRVAVARADSTSDIVKIESHR